MDRVIITAPIIGPAHMQVCAVSDVSDEEILEVCNRQNPSGTQLGWARVHRANDPGGLIEKTAPVQCAQHADRTHFLVNC